MRPIGLLDGLIVGLVVAYPLVVILNGLLGVPATILWMDIIHSSRPSRIPTHVRRGDLDAPNVRQNDVFIVTDRF